MRCACNRWGPGTTKDRIQDTESVRQLNASMEKLMLERSSQDNFWKGGEPQVLPGAIAKDLCKISTQTIKCDASLLPVEKKPLQAECKYGTQMPQNIRFWN
jgi:hypothetical protein